MDMALATSFQHRGLTPETTYSYRLRAWNAVGVSDESDALVATTGAASAPNQPTNLRLGVFIGPTFSNITALPLAWTAPASDLPILWYFLNVNGGGQGKRVVSTGRDEMALYAKIGVQPNEIYHFASVAGALEVHLRRENEV